MNSVFRSDENQATYDAYRAAGNLDKNCVLCDCQPINEFEHWRIIRNIFPYDKIAKSHDMIVPKRHVTELNLSEGEMAELRNIKETYLHTNYDFIIEPTYKMKSIPQHFHLHLIVARD